MNWLNWIEIILGALTLLWLIFWLRNRKPKHNDYGRVINDDWAVFPAMVSVFVILASCLLIPAVVGTNIKYVDSQVATQGKLVSLHNKDSISGNVSGGGSFLANSFRGSIGGSTTCSFVVRWKNDNITIVTSDCDDIIFREGDTLDVKYYKKVYYHPYSLKGKSKLYWGSEGYWEISIPADSIKSYINFN